MSSMHATKSSGFPSRSSVDFKRLLEHQVETSLCVSLEATSSGSVICVDLKESGLTLTEFLYRLKAPDLNKPVMHALPRCLTAHAPIKLVCGKDPRWTPPPVYVEGDKVDVHIDPSGLSYMRHRSAPDSINILFTKAPDDPEDCPMFVRAVQEAVRYLPLAPAPKILSLGCGALPEFEVLLKTLGPVSYVGVDKQISGIFQARQHLDTLAYTGEAVLKSEDATDESIFTGDIAYGTQDLVVMRHPEGLLDYSHAIADNAIKALKRGGVLLITCYSEIECLRFAAQIRVMENVEIKGLIKDIEGPCVKIGDAEYGLDRFVLIAQKK